MIPFHSNKFDPWISMSSITEHTAVSCCEEATCSSTLLWELLILWVLFSLLRKHIFTKEKYAEQINGKSFCCSRSLSPTRSPLFVPMLFMIRHSFVSLAQLLLVCFLTTRNLFQITWCCFDMSSECRNRCSTFSFSCSFRREGLWLWQRE